MDEPTTNKQARDKRRRNALKHGMRAVSLGSVPKGASYVGKLLLAFRRQLEAIVVEVKGEIDFIDACHVNTAARYEKTALLANRWLKLHAATMSHDQRLNYLREIARASENRDKAIGKIGLNASPQSVIEALYAPQIPKELTEDDGAN